MPLVNRIRWRLGVAHQAEHKSTDKPVYIYPGVIRMSCSRAIAIDTNCPAALFCKPRPKDGDTDATCTVCLEIFVSGRDIVRRLPCGHLFHSRCILSWVCKADRCPNCNDPVLTRERIASSISVSASSDEPLVKSAKDGSVGIPDVTPSTVCQLPLSHESPDDMASASDDVSITSTNRAYSFVLHDQARFAELLERAYNTRWTPCL